jgi:hypothetical protein
MPTKTFPNSPEMHYARKYNETHPTFTRNSLKRETVAMSSVDFLVKLRDATQMIADAANGYLEKLAPTETKQTATVKEEAFTVLQFEKQQGAKIGEYEVAYKQNNLADKWTQAYNILQQNNATISNRYYGDDYVYSYWLYSENKIYKQKLKQA